mmetsp:Transcript_6041/g.10728  ORF Transcript_6041/g.10728 Transcript_6041/m.10728 type:complete len:174 (-) Transcript_6041:869-1390(-)
MVGKVPPLEPMKRYIEWESLMGSWYVISCLATPFEKNAHDAVEHYDIKDAGKKTFSVTFKFRSGSFSAPQKTLFQDGRVTNTEFNSLWQVRPRFFGKLLPFPVWLPYIILELAEDSSHLIVGYPDRSYLWILSRKRSMQESIYEEVLKRCSEEWGYDLSRLYVVPHSDPGKEE